jgi:hypothetical protein
MLLINWRATTSCFSKPQKSLGIRFWDLQVYFFLFILFVKGETKERAVRQIHTHSLAFGFSTYKCIYILFLFFKKKISYFDITFVFY